MLRLVSFNMEYYWASSAALHEPELPTSPMQKVSANDALACRGIRMHAGLR